MKFIVISFAFVGMIAATNAASAGNTFTEDTKLACEAILCLSTGQRPSECAPSINRYFSIRMKKLSETLKARRNFLDLCPAATYDQRMITLVEAITAGSDRCDAAALNANLMVWHPRDYESNYIRDTLPSYCTTYSGHAYTDFEAPRYVGQPEREGFWVDADKYDAALARYTVRRQAVYNQTR